MGGGRPAVGGGQGWVVRHKGGGGANVGGRNKVWWGEGKEVSWVGSRRHVDTFRRR